MTPAYTQGKEGARAFSYDAQQCQHTPWVRQLGGREPGRLAMMPSIHSAGREQAWGGGGGGGGGGLLVSKPYKWLI